SPQFLDFAFQGLHALAFAGAHAITHTAVDLAALDPVQQRGRHTTDLRRNGLNSRPQRRILATVFLYQAHGALTDFRGKLVLLAHSGSIFSKSGASAKPGSIQFSSKWISSPVLF